MSNKNLDLYGLMGIELLQNNPNTIPWSVASKTDNVVDSVNYNSSDQGSLKMMHSSQHEQLLRL